MRSLQARLDRLQEAMPAPPAVAPDSPIAAAMPMLFAGHTLDQVLALAARIDCDRLTEGDAAALGALPVDGTTAAGIVTTLASACEKLGLRGTQHGSTPCQT